MHDRPSWRARGLGLAIAAATVLVVLRSAVFLIYPQSFFDSDQAIVGLMAKHLSEGRAFPLFFYGQSYMLGVDAWLAALVFLVVGPSVPALHAAILCESAGAIALALAALVHDDGLRPGTALLALLPIAFAPPLTSSNFVDGAATAAPFLYVPCLWWLRRRPLAFGAVAAVGFLHREFTIYGVASLLVLEACDGTLWSRRRARHWFVAAVTAVAMWQGIQALKPFADFMGPGTRGGLLHGLSGSQVGNLTERMHFDVAELPARVWIMATEHIPRVAGAMRVAAPVAVQGHSWLRWPLVGLLIAGLGRVSWLERRRRRALARSAAVYFLLVGLAAAAGYVATRSADTAIDRYLLLVLFLPVGVSAALLARDPSRPVRAVVVLMILTLAAGSAVDHARLARRYLTGQEPDDLRQLADALAARHITTAIAGYWRAYKITFVSRERIKVASSDFVRIDEYQAIASAQGPALLTIRDTPCDGDAIIPGWYLCRE